MTQELVKIHFEQSSARVAVDIDQVVEDMNSDQRAYKYPNPNDVPVPVNTENINWIERIDR